LNNQQANLSVNVSAGGGTAGAGEENANTSLSDQSELVEGGGSSKLPWLGAGLVLIVIIAVFIVTLFVRKGKSHPSDADEQPGQRFLEQGTEPLAQEEPQPGEPVTPQEQAAVDYIEECLSKNTPLGEVREALIKAGWYAAKVDDLLRKYR
jgi:hypothetical protein